MDRPPESAIACHSKSAVPGARAGHEALAKTIGAGHASVIASALRPTAAKYTGSALLTGSSGKQTAQRVGLLRRHLTNKSGESRTAIRLKAQHLMHETCRVLCT